MTFLLMLVWLFAGHPATISDSGSAWFALLVGFLFVDALAAMATAGAQS